MKDTLFLLTPGFQDGQGAPYYCPACTVFEGLLRLYPVLAEKLEVHRVEFAKPRKELVALLGELHQSCPVLVVEHLPKDWNGHIQIKTVGQRHFIDDPNEIGKYLSLSFGIPRPH